MHIARILKYKETFDIMNCLNAKEKPQPAVLNPLQNSIYIDKNAKNAFCACELLLWKQ